MHDALESTLSSWIQDDQNDAYNRHRFAVALWFLRTYADPNKTPAEHAASLQKHAGVPAVTLAQLRAIK